ncbi:MAG: hypothetical protein L6R36_003156 [Xanthoria steineri]|nr:MAG: hypothetical protein L6R36_003156 [Xanthoria steineri]
MASVARACTRLASSRTFTSRPAASSTTRRACARRTFQNSSRRGYASGPNSASSRTPYLIGALALAGAGGAYFYLKNGSLLQAKEGSAGETRGVFTPTKDDYQKVYNLIASRLEEKDDYDDGSYGPIIVRLAWHCSGTYDKLTNTGGSNGATMRFAPEGDHGANAGLKAARDFLEPVKQQFPWITYSDLWTLAGVCAIQEMQGPVIPWRPGRADRDVSMCTPDGRLPDGAKEQSHLRAIFGRMGFDDREIVALSGAHAIGRCHTDRSGFDGPWSFSPTVVTNDYYKLLLNEKWNFRKWDGPKQYQDLASKSLMMLPTDMALIQDKEFKKHVDRYAKDNDVFFQDFRDVLVKLLELGVPFQSKPEDRMELKPTS